MIGFYFFPRQIELMFFLSFFHVADTLDHFGDFLGAGDKTIAPRFVLPGTHPTPNRCASAHGDNGALPEMPQFFSDSMGLCDWITAIPLSFVFLGLHPPQCR